MRSIREWCTQRVGLIVRLLALAVIAFAVQPRQVEAEAAVSCDPQASVCEQCYEDFCDDGCDFQGLENGFCIFGCPPAQKWFLSVNECFGGS